MNKLLIIIPAYNEAKNIEAVVNDLIRNYPDYDYIIVNDGSTDDTAAICKQNQYSLLDLPINLGLSGAMRSGMRYAYKKEYAFAMQFDGDGQHDAKYIGEMMDTMERLSADIVIGSRFKNSTKPLSCRMFGSRLLEFCINLGSKKKLSDVTSGMRLFNQRMIKLFANELNYIPEPDTLAYLMRSGAVIEEVPVEMSERAVGESYLNTTQAIKYMTHMLFSIVIFQKFRRSIKE